VFTGKGVPGDLMAHCLHDLRRSAEARDAASILLCFKDLIPDYNPSAVALRRAFGESSRRAVASAG
jgi:hypothetical protein